MKRFEKILLSKMPIWITVVVLTLTVAGAVMFGAIVKNAATREALRIDNVHFPDLSRVALDIAKIPKNLHNLLFEPHPAETERQRFDGQAGLAFSDTAHSFGEDGGYLLFVRYLPEPTLDRPKDTNTHIELIDLSQRRTVHIWNLNTTTFRSLEVVDVLPDGSLILNTFGPLYSWLDWTSVLISNGRNGWRYTIRSSRTRTVISGRRPDNADCSSSRRPAKFSHENR